MVKYTTVNVELRNTCQAMHMATDSGVVDSQVNEIMLLTLIS